MKKFLIIQIIYSTVHIIGKMFIYEEKSDKKTLREKSDKKQQMNNLIF